MSNKIQVRTYRSGKRVATVRLSEGESIIIVNDKKMYCLGYPLDDQIHYGDTLSSASPVFWNQVSQSWERE
ncbi:MAG: hypothetical protein LBV29_03075 [Azoarcus sp.]|jgi:hypothetical protein|nr:hypothetical protein [Azoarcus sp.]